MAAMSRRMVMMRIASRLRWRRRRSAARSETSTTSLNGSWVKVLLAAAASAAAESFVVVSPAAVSTDASAIAAADASAGALARERACLLFGRLCRKAIFCVPSPYACCQGVRMRVCLLAAPSLAVTYAIECTPSIT